MFRINGVLKTTGRYFSASRLSRKKGPSCWVLVIEFQFFERAYISHSPEAANSGLVIKDNISLLYVCIFGAVVKQASQTSIIWVTFTYFGGSVDKSPPGTFHLEQRTFQNTLQKPIICFDNLIPRDMESYTSNNILEKSCFGKQKSLVYSFSYVLVTY